MNLRDMFDRAGTDKGCYAPAYEALLRSRRTKIRHVLEVGIGTILPGAHSSMHGWGAKHYRPGGSLRVWRDYFPAAQIVGVDVQVDTLFTEERISTFICNSTDADAVGALISQVGTFDVIIDDGSHRSDDQLATLRNFLPALRQFGLYFIEDIHQTSALYRDPRLVDQITGGAPSFAISDDNGASDKWKMVVIHRMP